MYRMYWFKCPQCDHEFEELVEKEEETITCPKCSDNAKRDYNFTKNIHRDGNHYNHVSWSLHHAGD